MLASGCFRSNPPELAPVVSPEGVKNVTTQEALRLIKAHKGDSGFLIIDDRAPENFAKIHISDATNIYLNPNNTTAFQEGISSLNTANIYLTYCTDGCGAAARIMREMGFQDVYNITGGLKKWQADGLPVAGSLIQ